MTLLTCLAEAREFVIRIRGFLIVVNVARRTLVRDAGVLSSNVTLQTRDRDVRAGQREAAQVVIKRCSFPSRCRVATRALVAKHRQTVFRVRCFRVVFRVTSKAVVRRTRVAGGVTLLTSGGHMRTRQTELRKIVIVCSH